MKIPVISLQLKEKGSNKEIVKEGSPDSDQGT